MQKKLKNIYKYIIILKIIPKINFPVCPELKEIDYEEWNTGLDYQPGR